MSNPKEPSPSSAAPTNRLEAISVLRNRAKTVVEQLHQDVLRLLEESHARNAPPPAAAEPSARPDAPAPDTVAEPAGGAAGPHAHMVSPHEVKEIVRAEIEKIDVSGLVKAEIETQLRAVTKLLQDRLKASPKQSLRKLSPILSRRRR